MNERIKELAEQAGIKIIPLVIDGVEYEYDDVDMDGSEDLEKFAELIIRECGLFCGHDYEGVLAMFKHFGVEQ